MADNEPTISMAGINAPPLYRLVEDGDKTVIMTADTNTPMWVINGDIAGGAKPMTTAERTAIIPSEGELIYDTELGSVYVGDGVTTGGVAIGSGGGGGGDYSFSNEFTVTAAGGVSINTISASKITGKVGSAGVADALVNGATVGYAQSAGTAETANGVTQAVKDDIISSAGGGSLDGEIASIDEVMTGITGGTTAVVDVSALRGALTAGQAVDVTSQPDGVAGDWKGTFNWTADYLGFDNTFPKYASGLSYLLIADLTYSSALGGEYILVTPSGTWLDGTNTAIRIDDGETKRVAMIFTSKTGKLTVDSFDPGDHIEVNHLREYEVTACSNEAIAYIAALSNPDAFADYYLVKADMIQPWTYIIDMGTSPAVTIASGLSYKLNASTGTHQLTVDTCPAGYDGRDAIIRIRLGGTGVIQAVAPLQLGGALVPYAINNCVVRFRDGEAVLLVEDTLAGYVVTVNSGTDEGTLPYGLAANGVPYIAFSPSTDGTPVNLSGATTAAEEVTVVGNGYDDTILTGSITCTSKTIVANLALDNVTVNGGTLTLGDAYIPSGSTVAVSGGGLAVERVSGNGGTIDLGKTAIPAAALIQVSGVTLTNGLTSAQTTNNASGGVFRLNNGSVGVSNATFVANSSTVLGGCAYIRNGATMTVANTVLNNNYSANGGCFYTNGVLNISSCTFSSNTAQRGGMLYVGNSGHATITDSEIASCNATNFGGAVALYGNNVDLTLVNCYVHDNGETNGAFYVQTNGAGSAHLIISGSTIQNSINMLESRASTTFSGTNVFGSTVYGSGSAIITSGAVVDLTGNTNPTPIAPEGGIVFKSGGATVLYSSGAVSGSYMMDNVSLATGAKLTNTNVVDLGGTNVGTLASGKTTIFDGVIITSGLSSGTNVTGGVFTASGTVIANSCTFANCSATYGGSVATIKSGARVTLNNCIVTGNSTGYGTIFAQSGTLVISGGTYTGNIASNGGGCAVITNGTVSATNAVISGNKASAAATSYVNDFRMNTAGGKLYLEGGCTVGLIACSSGTVTLKGSNSVTSVYGAGSMVISSGASINLTSSITLGTGGITVLTGGCTVNGNAIPAGTYTSINSNGQPT